MVCEIRKKVEITERIAAKISEKFFCVSFYNCIINSFNEKRRARGLSRGKSHFKIQTQNFTHVSSHRCCSFIELMSLNRTEEKANLILITFYDFAFERGLICHTSKTHIAPPPRKWASSTPSLEHQNENPTREQIIWNMCSMPSS